MGPKHLPLLDFANDVVGNNYEKGRFRTGKLETNKAEQRIYSNINE